jgi:PAS domain S-box-containing protein
LRFDLTKPGSTTALERLPWPVRILLGCCMGALAVGITCAIPLFHSLPFLLAFPTVVLSTWYLGTWGGAFCGITETLLVNLFLIRPHFQFSVEYFREETRLAVFLVLSTLLGWALRRLAEQRAQLMTQELQQQLTLAQAQRQLAQEQTRASEALRDRDAVLQIALRANGMGLWMWDRNREDLHWSDEVWRIAGREPGSVEPTTETWLSFVHPDDVAAVRAGVIQTREGTEYHQQHRVLWPDGSVRWVESQGKCQHDSDGRVTRVVGVLADITTRKQSEEAMLRAEKLAVAGRLAASVAHEINNPLEAVANLLYLITLADSTEVARKQAQQALDELMRVALITQQTLKFHRQTGTPKVTLLSGVIQTVLALFRGRLRTSQIEVELRCEHEVSILCMPGEVQQIVANLVTNAIDAMPRSGRLIIRLRPARDWRDLKTPGMRVTFFDSGVGMDKTTLQRIFEPFFTTKTETGTGLGMWVVAQLVERHHGSVRVWSTRRPDQSATAISLFLPLGDAAEKDLAADPAASVQA